MEFRKRRTRLGRSYLRIGAAAVLLAMGFAAKAKAGEPQTEDAQVVGMPQVENGKIERRGIKAGLAQEVDAWAAASQQAQWLGYFVPAVNGDHRMCCGNNSDDWNTDGRACGPCQLESGKSGNSYNVQRGNVKLEGSNNLVVLFRAEGRKIGKIRAVSDECVLDAGGLQVTWRGAAEP